jgi:hypothetical protein
MHVVLELDSTLSSDTIYHTIYDCNRLAQVVGDQMYCEGDTVVLRSDHVWIDQYRWFLNDSLVSDQPELFMLFDPGFYNVVSEFTNPVCTVCLHNPITISEAPNAPLAVSDDQLQSIGDYDCQWYFNNEPIPGETNSILNIESDGIYQLLWTSSMGCEAWSEEILINHVWENARATQLYPNPSYGWVRMELPLGLYHVHVFDVSGRSVLDTDEFNSASRLDVSQLTGGVYRVLAVSNNGSFGASLYIN